MLTIRRQDDTVLLFGAGLIGGRIGAALGRRGGRIDEDPTPWHDGDGLERRLAELEQAEGGHTGRLDVVWSAGRAGFASGADETRAEETNFRRVLGFAGRLAQAEEVAVVFHLVSSAGGLYEGQRHVDGRSRPRPRRPYGVLKLRLEELLEDLDAPLHKRVYRLASVFGPAPRGGRRGLIPTLLRNTREGCATPIVGQLDTLRDYVWTEDIARHLAAACTDCLGDDRAPDRIEILASGKPTSIHEILHHVKRVVGKTPCLVLAPRRDNATDITFARSALPAGWLPTDLETAVQQLHHGVFGT